MTDTTDEWIVTGWTYRTHYENMETGGNAVTIHRMNSPFYGGERFAVRCGSVCLSVDKGEFDYETYPSNRDAKFYEKYRFKSFKEACDAAIKAMKVLS